MSAYLQHRHSLVLALFAGCCGCDFTPDESGLSGVGEKTCVNRFLPFLDKPGTLSVESFARELNHISGFDGIERSVNSASFMASSVLSASVLIVTPLL